MSLDIQTTVYAVSRETYANLARRYGEDRPASRYDEAVMDVQPVENFHYRPIWDAEHELYDPARTAIEMEDWYALRDPRQFYYATYNISRAAMNRDAERAHEMVRKQGLVDLMDPVWRQRMPALLLALRHYEWGANMNAWYVADFAYGTAMSSAASFSAADRLGMAQILGSTGLLLDDDSGDSLTQAHQAWMEGQHLQPLRKAVEDSFVVKDWFETFVAQNLCLDGFIHPLVYEEVNGHGKRTHGAIAITLATAFMNDWYVEHAKWVDAVISTAAKASEKNAAQLQAWTAKWHARAQEAAQALAEASYEGTPDEVAPAMERVASALDKRLKKLGVATSADAAE